MTLSKTTTALTAILGVAVVATSVSIAPAEAGHRWHNGHSAAAAGIGGFVAGAIVGSALTQPRRVAPAPVYVQPRGGVTPAGVSVAHAQRCAARFRSYDWNSNTYVTYSGRVRYC